MSTSLKAAVWSGWRVVRHKHLNLRRRPSGVLLLLAGLLLLIFLHSTSKSSSVEEGKSEEEKVSALPLDAAEDIKVYNKFQQPVKRKPVFVDNNVKSDKSSDSNILTESKSVKKAIFLEKVKETSVVEPKPKNEAIVKPKSQEVFKEPLKEAEKPPLFDEEESSDDFLASMLKDYKKILFWNDLYKADDFRFGLGQLPFLTANCPVNKCYTTSDRKLFRSYDVDAVFWHVGSKDRSFPPKRSSHTMYVFFSLESPTIKKQKINYKALNGIFNWTNTYRRDSDFRFPYGNLRQIPEGEREETFAKNWALGRPNKAAWFVSSCNTTSDRSILAETLAKYIHVDTYGWCGSMHCDKTKIDDCGDLLEQNYKFYFAFENSLCLDYVTEKIFRTFKFNTVPIVYGLGYDSYNFPANSYIDVMDFESIEDVGKYLQYLTYNDTAYNEYFSWKYEYEIVPMWDFHKNNFCDMCRILHEMRPITLSEDEPAKAFIADNTSAYRQVYKDFAGWWVREGQCVLPKWNPQMKAFIQGETKEDILAKKEKEKRGIMNIARRESLFIL